MPSLLVQLEGAAEGTGIRFTKISTGERVAAARRPLRARGPGARSARARPQRRAARRRRAHPERSREANTAVATSNQASSAAEQSGEDAQTSTSTPEGGLPVGGGAGGRPTRAAPAPVGLETVPLELEFVGDFFHLADFFHDVKRFVHVVNTNVIVNGRLVTIDGVNFTSDPTLFPRIKAELTATVYLVDEDRGRDRRSDPAGPVGRRPARPHPRPTAAPRPPRPRPQLRLRKD